MLLDGAAWPLPLILRKVLPVLYRGLGQRVRLAVIAVPEDRQVGMCTVCRYVCSLLELKQNIAKNSAVNILGVQ